MQRYTRRTFASTTRAKAGYQGNGGELSSRMKFTRRGVRRIGPDALSAYTRSPATAPMVLTSIFPSAPQSLPLTKSPHRLPACINLPVKPLIPFPIPQLLLGLFVPSTQRHSPSSPSWSVTHPTDYKIVYKLAYYVLPTLTLHVSQP